MDLVRIFITGGTFDKEYNELTGKLYFKDSHLEEMLKLGRCRIDIKIHPLMMVDSLYMTPEDRETIMNQCSEVPEKRIVITHGTDTIVKTATLLAAKIKEKTIVLTGAMIPYKFGSSDGLFNLGSALAFAQTLSSGVFITMNGLAYPWDNVIKNYTTGFFEYMNPPSS